jgi:hypothetical protein
VKECADANTTVSNQLRSLSRRLTAKQSATPAVKAAMTSSTKVQKLAAQLSKTLEQTQGLREQLRSVHNELGLERDSAKRAQTETADLREELKRAGAARAEAVLRPLVDQIDALEPHIQTVATAITDFRAGPNWQNWQPQRGALGTALQPLYAALHEPFDPTSTTPTTAAPAEIQAAIAAIADRFQAALPPTLTPALDVLQRELRVLHDTVTASLRAVERIPAARGGRTRRRKH